MNIKKLLILTLISLLSAVNFAYPEEALTWKECVRQAKENSPDLISASENLEQAKADKDIDLSAMLPQVDAGVDAKRGKTANKKTTDTYSYSITGQQLIFDGFKTASELTGALKTIQVQQYNYNVVSSDVRLDLRSAFVGLMKAQKLIDIAESIAERRKKYNLEGRNINQNNDPDQHQAANLL